MKDMRHPDFDKGNYKQKLMGVITPTSALLGQPLIDLKRNITK